MTTLEYFVEDVNQFSNQKTEQVLADFKNRNTKSLQCFFSFVMFCMPVFWCKQDLRIHVFVHV